MLVTFLLRLRPAERGDWKYRDHLRRHKQVPEIDTNLSNSHPMESIINVRAGGLSKVDTRANLFIDLRSLRL